MVFAHVCANSIPDGIRKTIPGRRDWSKRRTTSVQDVREMVGTLLCPLLRYDRTYIEHTRSTCLLLHIYAGTCALPERKRGRVRRDVCTGKD